MTFRTLLERQSWAKDLVIAYKSKNPADYPHIMTLDGKLFVNDRSTGKYEELKKSDFDSKKYTKV